MKLYVARVHKGEMAGLPLKRSGWAMQEAPADGLVIRLGNEGSYLTEDELKELGYVKEPCTLLKNALGLKIAMVFGLHLVGAGLGNLHVMARVKMALFIALTVVLQLLLIIIAAIEA